MKKLKQKKDRQAYIKQELLLESIMAHHQFSDIISGAVELPRKLSALTD